VSCLQSRTLGREDSLDEALASTCVSFLAPELLGQDTSSVIAASAPPAKVVENALDFDSRDPDAAWDSFAWEAAYDKLAEEKSFPVLPGGAEIDRLQRSSPAEFSNAMLVGFVCVIFAVETLPGISLRAREVLSDINFFANVLFTLDYFARWWSRGLRPDYLLTPAMIFDFISILPFLLRFLLPGWGDLEFNFLKLLRVLRVYRYFRPQGFQNIIRVLLPPEMADEADAVMTQVSSYQLQVVRTFGVVFTLVFITAAFVYEAEHKTNPQFSDFFSSLYFSIIALSTVGFGDFAPITAEGRVAVSISTIVGLCIVPYQASLVASAYAEEERLREQTGGAEKVLSTLEETRAQLAWDAVRIRELEGLERKDRALLGELEGRLQSMAKP